MKITKKTMKWALGALLLSVPAAAYATTLFPVRVTVGNQPTNYRALVIDGTTYVALRDVGTLTGRSVAYSSATRTVNISDGGSNVSNNGNPNTNSPIGVGGTTQRSGTEGRVGQLLVTPKVAIRVDKIERKEDDPDAIYLTGIIRNSGKTKSTYGLRDAIIVTQDGDTVKYFLTANELGGDVYTSLQRGEQTRFSIRFRTQNDKVSRAVITLSADSGNDIVFRATF
jgi:hypothetical protein